MVILEFLLAVLYVLVVIVLVLLVIALAIPVGLLYGLYWLLFRSFRQGKKRSKKGPVVKPGVKGKDIKNIIHKAMASKNDEDFDKEEFKKEIHEFVDVVTNKEE